MTVSSENHAFVLAIEGQAKPVSVEAPVGADASELISAVRAHTGREDLIELLWEDIDEAIDESERLAERLAADFRLLHAATGGHVEVVVRYEHHDKGHRFRPSATIRRVIAWAISAEGFDLVGETADFQIKSEGRVVPPDTHVGQLGRCGTRVALTLVHNVKPQG